MSQRNLKQNIGNEIYFITCHFRGEFGVLSKYFYKLDKLVFKGGVNTEFHYSE